VEGHEAAVLAGAREFLGRAEVSAVMLETLHMDDGALVELATEWQLFVLDPRLSAFVRVAPTPGSVRAAFRGRGLYSQDAVLVPLGSPVPWGRPGTDATDDAFADLSRAVAERERRIEQVEKALEGVRAELREAVA